MHHAPVTEAHFVLGRVHVDVDAAGSTSKEQHEGRMPAVEQHVAIGLAHRVGHQLVAHRAAIDEEVLQVRLAARRSASRPSPTGAGRCARLDRQRLLQEARAADGHPPRARIIVGLVQAEDGLAVVAQVEATSKRASARRLITSCR
jgi:hypothetical protein